MTEPCGVCDVSCRDIHNMLVIDFLHKMRRYLKKYFEEFYPSDIDEKAPTCIQELKENFWWTINKQHEYSSISKSTKDEVIQMFNEMKHKLTELLSQGSWSSEVDKRNAISTVSKIDVSIIDSEGLSGDFEDRDIILENEISENNYFTNAYYSLKATFPRRLAVISKKYVSPGLFTFQPFISDAFGIVTMTSGLLQPPFLSASHSMSEKYGILGWLIGRHILSAVLREYRLAEQTQNQTNCETSTSIPFGTQLCCLSKEINSEKLQKEGERYCETQSRIFRNVPM
ncbi:unnamed protein product [Schistosoma spindalis]|nr:unnamed protein product [Schistosoma spindale]